MSRANEAAGPNARVTGVMTSPASGMVVSKPSWIPTGAAMYPVNHGLPRWVTWRATHHRSQA